MDLIKAKECIENFFKKLNFHYSVEVRETYIQGKATSVTLSGIDDDIEVNIASFSNGSMFVEFVFDKIPKLEKAAENINNLNQNFPFTKAYVSPKGYFIVAYSTMNVDSEIGLNDSIYAIFNTVASDEFIKELKKVTKLTKA